MHPYPANPTFKMDCRKGQPLKLALVARDNHLDIAIQDLAELPQSEKKEATLKLIDEIKKNEVETQNIFEEIDKLKSISAENNIWRFLPWFTSALSFYVFYIGTTAVISSEFCSKTLYRGLSCSHGTTAQHAGVTVTLIGIIIILLPLSENRWRSVILWLLGFLLIFSIFGALLVKLQFITLN